MSKPDKSQVALHKQSDSAVYTILKHSRNENLYIPVSPNTLRFEEPGRELRFTQALFCSEQNPSVPSEEFNKNLLVFYLFLTAYLVFTGVFALLLNSEGSLSQTHLVFHLMWISGLLVFSYGVLLCIKTKKEALVRSQGLFSALGVTVSVYLVLGDERVLGGITGEELQESYLLHSFAVACFIVMFRMVLFDSFVHTLGVGVSAAAVYLMFFLVLSPQSYFSTLHEFFVVFGFVFLLIVDTQKKDLRNRQLFWRKEKEEEALEPFERKQVDNSVDINTEVEILVQTCNNIKRDVKAATSVIMFKDVKKQLKCALNNLEKVKRRIAHGTVVSEVKFEPGGDIDEQDKAFISQMFMDVSRNNHRRSSSRKMTMNEIGERKPSFPFSNYGVAELESVLFSVGKNWSFDIWFVYNATGHSIFIVCKYLFQKWGFFEAFDIPEDTFDRYFQTLEKVSFT